MADQHEVRAVDISIPRSRALVLVQGGGWGRPGDRPDAEFLAQLIACKRRLPAYRQARQASPGAAANAYASPASASAARLNRIV